MIFAPKNEVIISKANLNANKRILNCQPFLHRGYIIRNSARRGHKAGDEYNETDRLLDDEGGPDKNVETVSTRQKKKKPSLTKTLWSLFGVKFAVAVLCRLFHDLIIFVQPQLLKYSNLDSDYFMWTNLQAVICLLRI